VKDITAKGGKEVSHWIFAEIDGLLVENGNQAEKSNTDHCRQHGGKEGVP
jgi:hypothetical protein